jgi:hypothetical protein
MIACDSKAVTDRRPTRTLSGRPTRLTWFNPTLFEELDDVLPNGLVRSPQLPGNRVDRGGTGTLQSGQNQATGFARIP